MVYAIVSTGRVSRVRSNICRAKTTRRKKRMTATSKSEERPTPTFE